ncbi:hypothetical protein A3J56_02975 [Candidatus Giovannonibacteria bacterium RIFCSPHIGHO2_02_FULL_46_20]|uniref:Uncharacterized protein n=1 Tax=Candidatus Giovannonibacteria bacterium RIFCSPHIGHO2_02_FULL_46_20 TaxID=1798338 RepID=A0A1F5WE51_9BACT|nr:MAG: hypothetical protein A3J56_02975 [Candidatus Giovannonibacteria bacterium RIFCSPHIGHO2_02_FULL_46_20]
MTKYEQQEENRETIKAITGEHIDAYLDRVRRAAYKADVIAKFFNNEVIIPKGEHDSEYMLAVRDQLVPRK